MTISVSGKQRRLLRFISGFIQAKGYSPSFTEMGAAIGVSSKGTIFEMVDALEDKGAIHRLPGRARAIEVLVHIPVPQAPDGAPLYFIPIRDARFEQARAA